MALPHRARYQRYSRKMVKRKVKKKSSGGRAKKWTKHSRRPSKSTKESKVTKLKRLASQRRAHGSKKKGILHRIFKR